MEFDRYNLEIPNSKEDNSYGMAQELIKELNEFGLAVNTTPGSRNVTRFVSGKNDDMVISLALANKASQSNFGNVSFRAI